MGEVVRKLKLKITPCESLAYHMPTVDEVTCAQVTWLKKVVKHGTTQPFLILHPFLSHMVRVISATQGIEKKGPVLLVQSGSSLKVVGYIQKPWGEELCYHFIGLCHEVFSGEGRLVSYISFCFCGFLIFSPALCV